MEALDHPSVHTYTEEHSRKTAQVQARLFTLQRARHVPTYMPTLFNTGTTDFFRKASGNMNRHCPVLDNKVHMFSYTSYFSNGANKLEYFIFFRFEVIM